MLGEPFSDEPCSFSGDVHNGEAAESVDEVMVCIDVRFCDDVWEDISLWVRELVKWDIACEKRGWESRAAERDAERAEFPPPVTSPKILWDCAT